jgi:hypothetical protein
MTELCGRVLYDVAVKRRARSRVWSFETGVRALVTRKGKNSSGLSADASPAAAVLQYAHSSLRRVHMTGAEERLLAGEQRVPLWTWLLEGRLPVAHIVADLDELEASEAHELVDVSSGRLRGGHPRAMRDAA